MQQILNQFSYVFISFAILMVCFIILRRYIADKRLLGASMLAIFGLALAAMLLLRPGSSDVASTSEFQQSLQNGKPTFVEFFSNYCAGCLALRPSVDLFVADIETEFNIIRIDIHTELGNELRDSYGFSYSPEFILFDRDGQEVWRDHALPQQDQILALTTS